MSQVFADIVAGMEDTELANLAFVLASQEMETRNKRQRVEREIQQRLEQRGASELPHPTLEVKLERPSPRYDMGMLHQLCELLPPETISLACIPEHVETQ
jgi:hypothetical protein